MTASKQVRSITQIQFFAVCEALRNNEEWLKEYHPTLKEAAEYIGKKVGFSLMDRQIANAQKATGVAWVMKPRKSLSGANTRLAIRNLAVSQIEICRQLGIPPTAGLQSVYDNYRQNTSEQQPSNNGQDQL